MHGEILMPLPPSIRELQGANEKSEEQGETEHGVEWVGDPGWSAVGCQILLK